MKNLIFKNVILTTILAILAQKSFELTLDPSNNSEVRDDPNLTKVITITQNNTNPSQKSVPPPGPVNVLSGNPSMRTPNGSNGTRLGPLDQKIVSIPLYDRDEDKIKIEETLESVNGGPIVRPGMFEDRTCEVDPYQPKCLAAELMKEKDRIVQLIHSIKYPLTMICQTNKEVCTTIMNVVMELDSIRPAELVRTLRPILEREVSVRIKEIQTAAEEAMSLAVNEVKMLENRLVQVESIILKEFLGRIQLFHSQDEVISWAKERSYQLGKAAVENFYLNDLSNVDPSSAQKQLENLMVEVRKAVADRGLDQTWKAVQGLLNQQ